MEYIKIATIKGDLNPAQLVTAITMCDQPIREIVVDGLGEDLKIVELGQYGDTFVIEVMVK